MIWTRKQNKKGPAIISSCEFTPSPSSSCPVWDEGEQGQVHPQVYQVGVGLTAQGTLAVLDTVGPIIVTGARSNR